MHKADFGLAARTLAACHFCKASKHSQGHIRAAIARSGWPMNASRSATSVISRSTSSPGVIIAACVGAFSALNAPQAVFWSEEPLQSVCAISVSISTYSSLATVQMMSAIADTYAGYRLNVEAAQSARSAATHRHQSRAQNRLSSPVAQPL